MSRESLASAKTNLLILGLLEANIRKLSPPPGEQVIAVVPTLVSMLL
jgi:hypothetical protein